MVRRKISYGNGKDGCPPSRRLAPRSSRRNVAADPAGVFRRRDGQVVLPRAGDVKYDMRGCLTMKPAEPLKFSRIVRPNAPVPAAGAGDRLDHAENNASSVEQHGARPAK